MTVRAVSEQSLAQQGLYGAKGCCDLRLRTVPAWGAWGRGADWYLMLDSFGQGGHSKMDHCEQFRKNGSSL